MKPGKISVEHTLFFLAFFLALAVRFLWLGASYLSDGEATLALQALNLASNSHAIVGGQPGYVVLTSALFYLLPSSEWLARFWPAFVGSLMSLAPFLFRKQLGKKAALCVAFFLALDPGMVAVSRQADSSILAVTFIVLALGFILENKPAGLGITAGLAILSGPLLWPGLLSLALAAGWYSLRRNSGVENDPVPLPEDSSRSIKFNPFRIPWTRVLFWAAVTLFIVGAGIFITPQVLGGIFSSLATYFTGWGAEPAFSPLRMAAVLFVYSPLTFLLGMAGLVLGFVRRDEVDSFLARWGLVALLLVVFYPGRNVSDLIWPLVPLLALVSREICRIHLENFDDFYVSVGQGALIFALLAFIWLNVTWLSNASLSGLGGQEAQVHLAAIAGGALLIVVISVLVIWGWSVRAALSGLASAIGLVLLLVTLSSTINAAGLGRSPSAEMWRSSPYILQGDLLMTSLADLSEWNTGRRDWLDLSVIGLQKPSLQWGLRNWKNVNFVEYIPPDSTPSLVITGDQQSLSLGSPYTGQAFALSQIINWSKTQPSSWINWFMFRQAIYDQDVVVFWVRSDLFPGAGPDTSPHSP